MINAQAVLSAPSCGQNQLATVALLGSKDMQTNFLSTLIRHELGRDCKILSFDEMQADPESLQAQLILLDCQSIPGHEMSRFVEECCDHGARVALINVQPGTVHEELVQWPQVKGMFYATVEQRVLIAGLKRLLQGGDWLPRHIMQRLIDNYRCAPRKPKHNVKLTRRERQVLIMLVDGSTNLQIADELEVSEYTIKSHLHNVFKKIDVKNRIQAYNWAQTHLSNS